MSGRVTAVAATALLCITGCADDPDASSSGAGSPNADLGALSGRSFSSTDVSRHGAPRPLVRASTIRLHFDAGEVRATAGCNQLGGKATYDGHTLAAAGPLTMTEMGCSRALMRQDRWLSGLLTSSPDLVLDGQHLTLTSGTTVVRLVDVDVADPDRPLIGTLWRLEALSRGSGPEGSVSTVPRRVTSTLRLTDAGELRIAPGCNTGSGRFRLSDGTVTISRLGITLMACLGDRGDVERQVLAVVRGEVAYVVDGPVLTLTRGDRGLVYRAAEGG